ncbi:integrase, partial [Bifidobacterium lemurum]
MTIPMSKQQDIRRLDAKGLPHTEIARRLGVDRGTVAKWAGMEDCSPKPPARRRVKSVLDGYKPLIDSWLEADRLMPRKQRHTAKRVHDRLRDEHGFTGSYSTVL